MSVAISRVECKADYDFWQWLSGQCKTDYDFWRWLSQYAELPQLQEKAERQKLPWLAKDAARIARARIWATSDEAWKQHGEDSERRARDRERAKQQRISSEVDAAINLLVNGENDPWLAQWRHQVYFVVERDPLLVTLPTKAGVEDATARLHEWWISYWGSDEKADVEMTLALAEDLAVMELQGFENRTDAKLAVVGFLEWLRKQHPGQPVTTEELRSLRHKRRVRDIGERFASGLSDELRSDFFAVLDRVADGELTVPCNGDARAEAEFTAEVWADNSLDRCRLAAAVLQAAHALHEERPQVQGLRTHPIHGYQMAVDGEWSNAAGKLRAVAPGLWRLTIEGAQYILTCELWPRPVVMSHHEFGRARGSANAILRDVGIAVDSPPGHWKAVWESHGLRNQLLATAERIDPRVRIEEFKSWIRRIALAAPAADRPPRDGAAVRLADGATVASCQWLIGQAAADGIIRPHEEASFEQTLRRASRETNRRDASRKQQRLLVLDLESEPLGNRLNNTRGAVRLENHDEA